MEVKDIFVANVICLIAGAMILIFQSYANKIESPGKKLAVNCIIPPVFWYIAAFGLIILCEFLGGTFPDWLGMRILFGGLVVLVCSITGAVFVGLKKINTISIKYALCFLLYCLGVNFIFVLYVA